MSEHLVFDTGCCKWTEDDSDHLYERLCPLHAAAPDLLAAGEAAFAYLIELPPTPGLANLTEQIATAICKAWGEDHDVHA